MQLVLCKYLRELKRQADIFARRDINGNRNDGFCAKYLSNILIASISIFLLCVLKEGFATIFVSYVSSMLSIFIGLFITVLIFSFDKFYVPKEIKNSRDKQWDIQSLNFFRQFTYITSYTIVLSLGVLILLLLLSALFKEMTINIYELKFDFREIVPDKIKLFLIALLSIVQRFLVLYWLFKIMYNILFVVSSMVHYMITKINREDRN